MHTIEVILPAMGEGIIEATIIRWLVAEGDMVQEDQSIVEVATDKVDSEVPSPVKGRVAKLHFAPGDIPKVGQTLVSIETEADAGVAPKSSTGPVAAAPTQPPTASHPPVVPAPSATADADSPKLNLSPLVRAIAQSEGLTSDELNKIVGTGLNNRITRDDVLKYVQTRHKVLEMPRAPQPETTGSTGEYEVVPMDRMRKLIAQHMVLSKQTSPHVTSFIEVDVTAMTDWRNRIKDDFLKREGEKLTLTPLFVDGVARAIAKYPLINSSLESDNIIMKKRINIGIAAALPNGNLIVPVIKDANKLSVSGLAQRVNDLAARARTNKLNPDEIQGGTFTITNLGMFDTLTGTPIINQPQVAILAIGSIARRVVVLNDAQGESIGIRTMVMLSLSYDHRVVDGALAGAFLLELKNYFQGFQPPF